MSREAWAAVLVLVAAGCSRAPDFVSTGNHESPCRGSFDCRPAYHCVEIDGASMCTQECRRADHACASGYACDVERGVCMPSGPACRATGARCGAGFGACCNEDQCVELVPWGRFCTGRCDSDEGCTSRCCVAAGGDSVCAPTPYCE